MTAVLTEGGCVSRFWVELLKGLNLGMSGNTLGQVKKSGEDRCIEKKMSSATDSEFMQNAESFFFKKLQLGSITKHCFQI